MRNNTPFNGYTSKVTTGSRPGPTLSFQEFSDLTGVRTNSVIALRRKYPGFPEKTGLKNGSGRALYNRALLLAWYKSTKTVNISEPNLGIHPESSDSDSH